MNELLLELFSEELPTFIQKDFEKVFYELFVKEFQNANISFGNLEIFTNPRRLVVYVNDIPEFTLSKQIEIKGPKIEAEQHVLNAFLKDHNIKFESLLSKTFNNKNYFVYYPRVKKQYTKNLLLRVLPLALSKYTCEHGMYWNNYSMKWVRPLRNIMCIFNNDILPIQFGHLIANNCTFGHRFLAPDMLHIRSYNDYLIQLRKAYVLINREERKSLLLNQLSEYEKLLNVYVNFDQDLIEEVIGLVENVNVLVGNIPKNFLLLPKELLTIAIKNHNKFFSVSDNHGNLARYFLFVSNIITDNTEKIIQGNERVLSARLSDALYLYNNDVLNNNLDFLLSKLDTIIFHTKIGNMQQKVARIVKICQFLAPDNLDVQYAAKICKFDIVTKVVTEFPELQGIMGYYYAKHFGVSEKISNIIKTHYNPSKNYDFVPKGNAAILAISDKLDSLIGLIIAGESISSSKDLYGLRRYAFAIIRIIIENNIQLNIVDTVKFITSLYPIKTQDHLHTIINFIEDKTKSYFSNNYNIKFIDMIVNFSYSSDIIIFQLKLKSLKALSIAKYTELAVIYKRVNKITYRELNTNISFLPELINNRYENKLFATINELTPKINEAVNNYNYDYVLVLLSKFNQPLTEFFKYVQVNDSDSSILKNRLALLIKVKNLFLQFTAFEKLE